MPYKENNHLRQLISGQKCILFDYPTHGNIGDHLIYLGEKEFCKMHEVKILFSFNIENYKIDIINEKYKSCVILMHGGGNFGDIWRKHTEARNDIIRNCKGHKIIIMPQTIYYRDLQILQEDSKIINSHPNLTIMLRDKISLDLAQKYFRCDLKLAHDMAFSLSAETVNNKNVLTREILYVLRRDKEKGLEYVTDQYRVNIIDWSDLISSKVIGIQRNIRVAERINGLYGKFGCKSFIQNKRHNIMDHIIVGFHYKKSIELFKIAKCKFVKYPLIITNRLHAHILATILRIPNILLPNSYYKNASFYEAWTEDDSISRFASNKSEVESAIVELIDKFKLNI